MFRTGISKDPEIPKTVRDSSAAAVIFSGMLDLLDTELDKTKAEKYEEIAYKILEALSKNYLAENSSRAILMHGYFDKPDNVAIDNDLVWGITVIWKLS